MIGDGRTAGGLANQPAVRPVTDCAGVANLDLTGVTDAPVSIQSATLVTTGAPAPYCQVKATIAPADRFELRLPTQGWTQHYLQVGCGGLCGSIRLDPPMAATCQPVTDGAIAMATTDMGHEDQNDGSWAANNPQAQIDFAYRGMHVLAQVSRAIITRFYGRPPRYAYFDGCSDGGREALMEAQRYPDDAANFTCLHASDRAERGLRLGRRAAVCARLRVVVPCRGHAARVRGRPAVPLGAGRGPVSLGRRRP
jgi:Tannase and feruloyl esterase